MGIHLVAALVLASTLQVSILPLRDRRSPYPLFNGTDLGGWVVPEGKSKQFVVRDGVLQIKGDSDWLLTTTAFNDFVLTFEARAATTDSVGGVLVRAATFAGHRVAYEVQVANREKSSSLLLQHYDRNVVPSLDKPPAVISKTGQWYRYRVKCTEDVVRVWRDGVELVAVDELSLTTAPIALHAIRGAVEVRNVHVMEVAPPQLVLPEGAVRLRYPLTESPHPIKRVKPRYPRLAMDLKVEGEVWVECVVETDGRVEQCVVVRRLLHELEMEALRAAKAWRFKPGTRNGTPVPVVVTIQMTFTLR